LSNVPPVMPRPRPKSSARGSRGTRAAARAGSENFVADAAGGMFVHERAFVFWKFQHVAGSRMASVSAVVSVVVEAAKIDGHEQRGHLVIGNFSGGEFAD